MCLNKVLTVLGSNRNSAKTIDRQTTRQLQGLIHHFIWVDFKIKDQQISK